MGKYVLAAGKHKCADGSIARAGDVIEVQDAVAERDKARYQPYVDKKAREEKKAEDAKDAKDVKASVTSPVTPPTK